MNSFIMLFIRFKVLEFYLNFYYCFLLIVYNFLLQTFSCFQYDTW